MSSKLKVYELAKELALDPQHLVDVVQRLGIDIKNSMSVLGSEEVRTVREHYKKNRMPTKAGPATGTKSSSMTEKRVGATVIRRRSVSPGAAAPTAPEPEPEPEVVPEPVELEAEVEETAAEATPQPETPARKPRDKAAPTAERVSKESKAEPPAPVAPPPQEEVPEVAMTPAEETPPTVTINTPLEPPKPRRIYPSIVKKVSTEQYLGEVIGPKLERKERPKTPVTTTPAAKPRTPGAPGTGVGVGFGAKRGIKEIEVSAPTDTSKDAANKRGRAPSRPGEGGVFRSTDYLKRELIHATKKKKNAIARPALKTQITTAAAHKRVVDVSDTIRVSEMALQMGVKATAVIGKLMGMGVSATMNQSIDFDTATLVAAEFGFEAKQVGFQETNYVPELDLAAEKLQPRGPVVTIMGHVDHGKTSLLDYIRKAKVAAGEAGGITQHVGAYTVEVPKGRITFLDTPGHEAFTAMRARGAKVTDIVVLVVSAVDGVMPQTIESLNHAKAANVPIIVAVNKIDLPDATPDRVKQTLAGHNLNPEEWGGDTIYQSVSAKTGVGVDALLESILLQAELLELKANFETPARGSVIESKLDKARGPLATVLVQHGRLRSGDIVVCGTGYGKVRAMTNPSGQKIAEALPGDPVELLGLPVVPTVGDDFFVVADERTAKELTEARVAQIRAKAGDGVAKKLTLDEMLAAAGGEKEIRIILRADVQGSAEALREALSKLPQDKVKMKLLHVATGGVTESDIMLATASRAVILGFNIRPDVKAQKLADQEGVELQTFTIIYDLIEAARGYLEGMLDKTVKERVIGRAEVREVFSVPKVGVIAGSAVIDGKVQRGCYLRLLRDSRVVYEGKISSLRRFKEDVKEVASGFECGIGLENFNDLKLGDQFEAYLKEESKGIL